LTQSNANRYAGNKGRTGSMPAIAWACPLPPKTLSFY
jgi:hypothetical protein